MALGGLLPFLCRRKNCRLVLMLYSLLSLVTTSSSAAPKPQPPGVIDWQRQTTRLDAVWAQNFWQGVRDFRKARHESMRQTSGGYGIVAFAPPPSSLVAAINEEDSHSQDSQDPLRIVDLELWVSDRSGRHVRHLATEPGDCLVTLQWSPDGQRLAYITRNYLAVATETSVNVHLYVVDVRTGRKVTVAAHGAAAPQWTADGQTLRFWRLQSLTPDKGQWQPYQATFSPGDQSTTPAIEPASTFTSQDDIPIFGISNLEPPGIFSHDGQHVFFFEGQKLIDENLATHQRIEHFVGVGFHSTYILLSGDSQWMVLIHSIWGSTVHVLLNVANGRRIGLAEIEAIKRHYPLTQNQWLTIGLISWLPGPGHRLLMIPEVRQRYDPLASFRHPLPRPPTSPHPAAPWRPQPSPDKAFIYDPSTQHSQEIRGFDYDHSPYRSVWFNEFAWSLDGHFLALNGEFYAFHPPL